MRDELIDAMMVAVDMQERLYASPRYSRLQRPIEGHKQVPFQDNGPWPAVIMKSAIVCE